VLRVLDDVTEIRILFPLKCPARDLWLKLGERLEEFGLCLEPWQFFVDKNDQDIELVGEEVTWEKVFDMHLQLYGNRNVFGATLGEWDAEVWLYEKKDILEVFMKKEEFMKMMNKAQNWWSISLVLLSRFIKQGGYEFCDRMLELSKVLFVELEAMLGVGGQNWPLDQAYLAFEWEKLIREGVLQEVPAREHPSWSPIWFYLLNREMYEASKEYIAKLTFKRVEELSNGGVLLFVDYPYTFEFFDKPCVYYVDRPSKDK
jgi:hypothetical protein